MVLHGLEATERARLVFRPLRFGGRPRERADALVYPLLLHEVFGTERARIVYQTLRFVLQARSGAAALLYRLLLHDVERNGFVWESVLD